MVADLLFIVSRTELKRYMYLKHVYADVGGDVILDRRAGERRRGQGQPPTERRRGERRHRETTQELQSCGWTLVRRGGIGGPFEAPHPDQSRNPAGFGSPQPDTTGIR